MALARWAERSVALLQIKAGLPRLGALPLALLTVSCGTETLRIVRRPEDAPTPIKYDFYKNVSFTVPIGVMSVLEIEEHRRPGLISAMDSERLERKTFQGNEILVSQYFEKMQVFLSGTPVFSSDLLAGKKGSLRLEVPLLNFARENAGKFYAFHAGLTQDLGSQVVYSLDLPCPRRVRIHGEEIPIELGQSVCRINEPIYGKLARAVDLSALDPSALVEVPIDVRPQFLVGKVSLETTVEALLGDESREDRTFQQAVELVERLIEKADKEAAASLPMEADVSFSSDRTTLLRALYPSRSAGIYKIRSDTQWGVVLESRVFERRGAASALIFKGTALDSLFDRQMLSVERANPDRTRPLINSGTPLSFGSIKPRAGSILSVQSILFQEGTSRLSSPRQIDRIVPTQTEEGCVTGNYECADPMRTIHNGSYNCCSIERRRTVQWEGGSIVARNHYGGGYKPGYSEDRARGDYGTCHPHPFQVCGDKVYDACSTLNARFHGVTTWTGYERSGTCSSGEAVMVPFCVARPAPAGFSGSYRAFSSVPSVDGYRFVCSQRETKVLATENRWMREQHYENPFVNPILTKIESGPEINEAIQKITFLGSGRVGERAAQVAVVGKTARIPSEIQGSVQLEISTNFKREYACGSRVEHFDGTVLYACVAPGSEPISRQYNLEEERRRLSLGEDLSIRQSFYPSHTIEFNLYQPKETE